MPPVIFLTFFGYLFIIIFFCGDPKMGYNRCPLFIMLTEHRRSKFYKDNQSKLLKLIWSKLDRSETLSLQQSSSASNIGIPSGDSLKIKNMRSPLATSFDNYRNTRSLLAISFNQLGTTSGDSYMKYEI